MSRTPQSPPRVSRRTVLQGGAIAAGFVWTAPVARTIRLDTIVGSPAPTTDPTEVTVVEPYEPTTTTTRPDENPYSHCHLHTHPRRHDGSCDIDFEFRNLRPGRALRCELDYLDGVAVSSSTMFGTVDHTGTYKMTPGPAFPKPWSAAIALFDDVTGATLLRGTFSVRRRGTPGEFQSH